MQPLSLANLLPVLQTAIGPVILLSGIGLILLTMTNRFGRVIDLARALARQVAEAAETDRPAIRAQIDIMFQRANLLRLAIALLSMSALASAVLVIAIFLCALWGVNNAWVIALLFAASMVFLIASLLLFIKDINSALTALKLELNRKDAHRHERLEGRKKA